MVKYHVGFASSFKALSIFENPVPPAPPLAQKIRGTVGQLGQQLNTLLAEFSFLYCPRSGTVWDSFGVKPTRNCEQSLCDLGVLHGVISVTMTAKRNPGIACIY